ncbi:hypothetical protein LIER_09641 [Lithospermum erythrorhizon]|uniref:Uncharacterized protein n=1 Tax=Lithospermum erythrorhizon TaxID=34254 RepID=A0AAV3PI29_LITER
MGKHGCTLSGDLDESSFSEPMPWIGSYAAAASAACAIAMAIDALQGIRNRKFWFPCKYFSLNATTLTLIAVATKLSVDLNTSMPGKQDQLAKLSSSVFICTAMANFLPSLGSMENKELLTNMIALAILIITVIANTCIQLATGVIYMFWKEHAVVMYLMLALLAILISTALTIPATKYYFEQKYNKKYDETMDACQYQATTCKFKKLRNDLARFWMMAHTSSPQFVVARLATCTASGAACLLSTVVLAEAALRTILIPSSMTFCRGDSDYKWSSFLILFSQVAAIGVGSIAPAFRWSNAINFHCPKKAAKDFKLDFKVEDYWIQSLRQWKEYPLVLGIYGRCCRKFVQEMKDKFLSISILVQKITVFFCKFLRFMSIFFAGCIVSTFHLLVNLINLMKCHKVSNSTEESRSHSYHYPEADLEKYVLHLEGEETLIDLMMRRNFNATNQWIKMGEKKQPKRLLQLMKDLPNTGFEGVRKFDTDKAVSLAPRFQEPPNCWALPVVTLTSITIALCSNEFHLVKELISNVKEGLGLIRIVDEYLDLEGPLISASKAADMVWIGVDNKYEWLDLNLLKMKASDRSSREILQELADKAKSIVMEFLEGEKNGEFVKETPSKWPIKILAANSMYRTSATLLQSLDISDANETQFEKLSIMITHIMGACLTNLRRVISMECQKSAIEEREERVRNSMVLFGKTKALQHVLDDHSLPDIDPEYLAYIDKWRGISPC